MLFRSPNAVAEVREAVDFLRYYAEQARATFDENVEPLGPVVCISPWNFPLAIFTGEVAAALVAGNTVLAKPAEETPLIAAQIVDILYKAGIPEKVLQLLPGDGSIGAALVGAPEVCGVIFTGSTEVAKLIQAQLAERTLPDGSPLRLIAETGGQNAMVVDSSALPEQVVRDVIASAFDSAGQRCSALRILCVQEEIADELLSMLKGAIAELKIGPTDELCVDVGPVRTSTAFKNITAQVDKLRQDLERAHKRIDELERLVDLDPLVPVSNRRAFVREVSRSISFAERYGTKSSLVFFDMNDMKHINDNHGHAAGDKAILHVAECLRAGVRDLDVVGRLGGDEFGVLLAQTGEESAAVKANELSDLIEAKPIVYNGTEIIVHVAHGAYTFGPGQDPAEALAQADEQMYRNKKARKAQAAKSE